MLTRTVCCASALLILSTAGIVNAQPNPEPPSNLVASITGTTVTLQWTPPGGGFTTGYLIEAGSAPGLANLASIPTSETTVSAANVALGTYYIRVRGANGLGVTEASSNEIAVTVGSTCTSAPSIPGPITSSVTGSVLQLSWGLSPGHLSSYILEASSVPGAANLGVFDLGTPKPSFLAVGVPDGVYYVRVRARNACGMSGPSDEVAVNVGTPCSGTPGVPGTLSSTVNGSIVFFAWGASSGPVSAYILEAGSTPGASNLGAFEVPIGTNFSVAGVPSGTYHIRVRARNSCGRSGPSNDTIVVVLGPEPTGAPRLEIVNAQSYTIQIGESAGQMVVAGEVVNRGGAASSVFVGAEVFSPSGSRLRGVGVDLIGRSRRELGSQEVQDFALGPGESGCYAFTIGEASAIGRYDIAASFQAAPTEALSARLQADATWGPITFEQGLQISPKLTNVGTTTTAWNSVAFVIKDTSGRVLGCGKKSVVGPTNGELPGYGFTNVLRPGETAFPLNGSPVLVRSIPFASVGSVSVWPVWKQ